MIPRSKRLSRRTFPTIRGKTLASGAFSLVYGPSSDGGCAAVVSKKVARRSVDRHLLKGRITESMRRFKRCRSTERLATFFETTAAHPPSLEGP